MIADHVPVTNCTVTYRVDASATEACIVEGFRCIAIEREADYLPLILQRISKPIETVMF